jgi:hexosaminidase
MHAVDDNTVNVALQLRDTLVQTVMDNIKIIYQEVGAPLAAVHMAGDEVPHRWVGKSPAANTLR